MRTNVAVKTPAPRTHEGAVAVRIHPKDELRRTVMACLLFEDTFYEGGKSVADRIMDLVPKVKPEIVRDMAIEARQVHNLRHAPLWLALAMVRAGKDHRAMVGDLLPQIMLRADEPAEFLAMYWKGKRTPLANQVKKGLAKAMTRFNEYQLAKYNRDGAVKLRDVLFLSHAKPSDLLAHGDLGDWEASMKSKYRGVTKRHANGQGAVWNRLANGKLAVPETWEVGLSAAKTPEARRMVWSGLIAENKLGALALLRNLRNMTKDGISDSMISGALRTADYRRVLPFRFIAAARHNPQLEPSIEMAMLQSFDGVEKIPGKTVLLIDVSGSMDAQLSAKSDMTRMDAAAGLGVVAREMFEKVRIFSFSHKAVEVPVRRGFALRDAVIGSQQHGGTYLGKALSEIILKVGIADRIIVITDEQVADQIPAELSKAFDKRYMINVGTFKNGIGYGKWTHIDGFSEAVVKWIREYERETFKEE